MTKQEFIEKYGAEKVKFFSYFNREIRFEGKTANGLIVSITIEDDYFGDCYLGFFDGVYASIRELCIGSNLIAGGVRHSGSIKKIEGYSRSDCDKSGRVEG